jgi:imidazolonepropionase-like amidohydrolase
LKSINKLQQMKLIWRKKMKNRKSRFGIPCLMITMILWQGISFNTLAQEGEIESGTANPKLPKPPRCQLLTANKLFDGVNFPQDNMAVLIEGNKVKRVGSPNQLRGLCRNRIDLGDATILPGFIESHAHISYQNIRKDKLLEHGITTVQDTGGPLMKPEGGQGALRLLSTGPIIQASGGYPLNVFDPDDDIGGYDKIGIAVSSVDEVEGVVQNLADGGATAIKISLEPGGEAGAPWMMSHGDHLIPDAPWPMLSEEIVQAIVAKAHGLDKPLRVIAHVGEQTGFDRALAGGVDELAHMPCAAISEQSLQDAVNADVTFVTTIDTLSSCSIMGLHGNAFKLGMKGAELVYGAEIGHDNVPWGINGEEMRLMLHLTSGDSIDFTDVINVFKAATSKAGEHLGIPGLGTLKPGAPADIIAVKGNPFERFKILEYPDLVMSGGRTIVNKFKK